MSSVANFLRDGIGGHERDKMQPERQVIYETRSHDRDPDEPNLLDEDYYPMLRGALILSCICFHFCFELRDFVIEPGKVLFPL
jgi:hypothetical protein